MVKVKIERNALGELLSFSAEGHAGFAEHGADIVCAAVSAVMQTTLLGLGEYLGLEKRLTYQVNEDGWLYCKLPRDLSLTEQQKAEAIVETMYIGLKSIQTEYPKYITVEEEVE